MLIFILAEEIDSFTCEICSERFYKIEAAVFDCMHLFCRECAEQYLRLKIEDGEIDRLKCLQCDAPVSDDLLRELVSNQTYLRFENLRHQRALEKYGEGIVRVKINFIFFQRIFQSF